jgi:hypothetical protein
MTLGVLVASPVFAANVIDVRRGADSIVFGSCVPSLTVENKSGETIDFLQVDLVMTLSGGRERTVALRSSYRDGVRFPIAPGGKATLKQQLDLEKSIGVPCGDVTSRRVVRTICENRDGKACASPVSVVP